MNLEQAMREELPGGTKGVHGCPGRDSGTEESRVVLAAENQGYAKMRGFMPLR